MNATRMPDTTLNPFAPRPSRARAWENVVRWIFRLATYAVVFCGGAVFLNIVVKGSSTVFQPRAPFINTHFLFENPESLYVFDFEGQHHEMGDREFRAFRAQHANANIKAESIVYSAGGIFPCIVGTLLLVAGSMSIALILGVSAAVYLNEYAKDGPFIRFIRLAIVNLAGVPSIVFGLFGFGLFVIFLGWNVSLLSGWFTLAFMVLPVVITASEESLKAVPKGFREGSLTRCHALADDSQERVAVRAAGNSHLEHSGHRPGGRRNGADHVHGRVCRA